MSILRCLKIYFCDTGLACYLARLNNPEVLRKSRFNGRFIINEIIKSYTNNNKKPNFYYYRDNEQNETDLVILDKGILELIECKSGISYKLDDVKAFKVFKNKSKYQIGKMAIICNTQVCYTLSEDIFVLPITSIKKNVTIL